MRRIGKAGVRPSGPRNRSSPRAGVRVRLSLRTTRRTPAVPWARCRNARETERPTPGWLFPMEATVSCRGPAPPSRTSTRVPSTPAHSGCSSIAVAPCSREWLGDPAPGLNGGGGIRTLGPPCDGQRFSRPRRIGRKAASQLESAPRGNAGENESRPRCLCDPSAAERQCCSHGKGRVCSRLG
jgi:hypothetical protein